MSALEMGTWAAIGALTVGAIAVFGWFLADVLREIRRRNRGESLEEGGEGDRSG